MGQVFRMLAYNARGAGEASLPTLSLGGEALTWTTLDDGVMGGRSTSRASQVVLEGNTPHLRFSGTCDTRGGGFASIRATLPPETLRGSPEELEMKLRLKGDGRTYKVLLSNGAGGGPFSKHPSWQADVATDRTAADQVVRIPLSTFRPSFGGRSISSEECPVLAPAEMRQVGLMLSLYLSNGEANPVETFGAPGTAFDFSLDVMEMAIV